MVRTLTYGTESEANTAIGGVPVIHYFDFQSRGRGQAVRLLLIDAGAAYKDIRYSFDEWPEHKRKEGTKLNPTTNIPIVEMPNGKILTQSYAIIRHWARQLNAYDGKTEDEKYFVDLITDIVIDWRTRFVDAAFSSNKEDYEKHKAGRRGVWLQAIETHLNSSDFSRSGPYVLGNDITYADIVLYQILHDEGLTKEARAGLKDQPRLKQLVDAIEARPNVKKFLESDAYLG